MDHVCACACACNMKEAFFLHFRGSMIQVGSKTCCESSRERLFLRVLLLREADDIKSRMIKLVGLCQMLSVFGEIRLKDDSL